MNIRLFSLVTAVVFLITITNALANTEESISPKDKAIELAKKCVMLSGEFRDITAQEVINMVNNSVCSEHIKNYIAIGWEAIDVSESIYTVVYKVRHDNQKWGYLFHVAPKDNIAWFVDLGEEKERQMVAMSVYLEYIKTLSTYTSEIVLQKINKILSACINNEEDMRYLQAGEN
jgi:hypothetical protein